MIVQKSTQIQPAWVQKIFIGKIVPTQMKDSAFVSFCFLFHLMIKSYSAKQKKFISCSFPTIQNTQKETMCKTFEEFGIHLFLKNQSLLKCAIIWAVPVLLFNFEQRWSYSSVQNEFSHFESESKKSFHW